MALKSKMALKSLTDSFSYHLKDENEYRQRYSKKINEKEIILSFVECHCANFLKCDWKSAWEIGVVYHDDVIIKPHVMSNMDIINVINEVESKFPDKIDNLL